MAIETKREPSALSETELKDVSGGDNDGNAGEREARTFMESGKGKTLEGCSDIGPTINGYQGQVCMTIRPSNPLSR